MCPVRMMYFDYCACSRFHVHFVQFRPWWYLCAQKSLSQTFPLKQFQCLSDWHWSLLSFQGKLSNASSFRASLLRAINCVMSLALCPQVVFQAHHHFRSAEPLVMIALSTSLFAQSFPFTPACPQEFSKVDVDHWHILSGLPIPLFTFCSELIESVRRMACEVWLSPLEAVQWRSWVTASTSIVMLEVETIIIVLPSKKRRPSSEQPWEGWLPLPWPVAAGCGHGPQLTQSPHIQENEAGTITNLQLQSWRLEGQTYAAEMPASADSKNKCVANSSPATHQTLRQQGVTGEDGHIHLADCMGFQCSSDQEEKEIKHNQIKVKIKVEILRTSKPVYVWSTNQKVALNTFPSCYQLTWTSKNIICLLKNDTLCAAQKTSTIQLSSCPAHTAAFISPWGGTSAFWLVGLHPDQHVRWWL